MVFLLKMSVKGPCILKILPEQLAVGPVALKGSHGFLLSADVFSESVPQQNSIQVGSNLVSAGICMAVELRLALVILEVSVTTRLVTKVITRISDLKGRVVGIVFSVLGTGGGRRRKDGFDILRFIIALVVSAVA